MKALAARRRHPLATVVLLTLALLVTGAAYALFAPGKADASTTTTGSVERGQDLFLANCATCHGLKASGTEVGPSLIGVGAAAVDFQVGTGRMPMQQTAPQAPQKPVELSEQDTADLAAYVASLAPGPAIPDAETVAPEDDDESLANGAELFRVNCAMCHNVVGAGGALTRGKFAPALAGVSPTHAYEAMVTGPQSMPVFNDQNITPENKKNVIAFINETYSKPNQGGMNLGNLGPVSEGMFIWIFGLGAIVAITVWITAKSN